MRVLLTRAQAAAERTARRLGALGHAPLIAPTVEIVATGAPMPKGSYEGIVVTSAHAAEALGAIADKDHLIFAVGGRTAEAVTAAGFASVLVASGDAVSLSALIRRDLVPGTALLHVTGRHHKAEPDASLRAAGYCVDVWEAYDARAVASLPAVASEALRGGRIDIALHYSRRSLDILLRLVDEAGLMPAFRSLRHVCLSADVAAPLGDFGLEPAAIAARPDEDSLLSLVQAFEKPSHRPS